MKGLFITGTDTEVGKTFVTVSMLQQLASRRFKVVGFKPVASGCSGSSQELRNADALALQAASTIELSYQQVNPYAFEPAIAPHIAAQQSGRVIELSALHQHYAELEKLNPDFILTEGAGGWRLPLDQNCYLSDFARQEKMEVILVVGMRLGCLNHAVLSAETIERDGLKLAGWVANQIELDMPDIKSNLESLKHRLTAPFLGYIPRLNDPESSQQYLDLTPLL
ncbi:dethiobiotin synthase [Lacimicrobium alkaliphilum]|nr:dethiobiotin synthase [Lacimicrobium alkaliphilum]